MFYNVAKDNIAPPLPIVGSIYETGKTIVVVTKPILM